MTAKTTKTSSKKRANLNDKLITTTEIANRIGVTVPAVSNHYKKKQSFPKPAFQHNKVVLYWRDEIEVWIKENMRNSSERANNLEIRAQMMLETAKRMREMQ